MNVMPRAKTSIRAFGSGCDEEQAVGSTAYVPVLPERSSAVGPPAQAANFLESLLSYQRMDTGTPRGNWTIDRMLGVGTVDKRRVELAGPWGWTLL